MDKCGCKGEMFDGLCPSQPGSIKCCQTGETTTSAGEMTMEAAVEACKTETTISQCLEERKKRSSDCSSEYLTCVYIQLILNIDCLY